jgi:hypothetical protein
MKISAFVLSFLSLYYDADKHHVCGAEELARRRIMFDVDQVVELSLTIPEKVKAARSLLDEDKAAMERTLRDFSLSYSSSMSFSSSVGNGAPGSDGNRAGENSRSNKGVRRVKRVSEKQEAP